MLLNEVSIILKELSDQQYNIGVLISFLHILILNLIYEVCYIFHLWKVQSLFFSFWSFCKLLNCRKVFYSSRTCALTIMSTALSYDLLFKLPDFGHFDLIYYPILHFLKKTPLLASNTLYMKQTKSFNNVGLSVWRRKLLYISQRWNKMNRVSFETKTFKLGFHNQVLRRDTTRNNHIKTSFSCFYIGKNVLILFQFT